LSEHLKKVRILTIGDIVGRPGRTLISRKLPSLRDRMSVDFCIANGENAAGGSGITPEIVDELLKSGIDVITSGDHIYKRKEIIGHMRSNPRLLRPANYGERAEGTGYGIFDLPAVENAKIAVINLVGRVFMNPSDCPFKTVDAILKRIQSVTELIIVDMHAEATSEKIAMGWYLDGRVTAVVGTHTHVQTADERILPGGTAYITDLGMTGPHDSILGRRKDRVLEAILTHMPKSFDVAKGDVRLCGALITADVVSGKALEIKRVQVGSQDEP